MLLNSTNGDYIKIVQVDLINNKIVFEQREHDHTKKCDKSIIMGINMFALLDEGLSFADLYPILKEQESLITFEISDDNQNWLSPNKSSRVYVDNGLILLGIQTHVDGVNDLGGAILDVLIDSKIDTDVVIVRCSKDTVVYANGLNPLHAPILMPYVEQGLIKIEQKLFHVEPST